MEECLQTSSVSHVISKIITKHQKVGELEQRGQFQSCSARAVLSADSGSQWWLHDRPFLQGEAEEGRTINWTCPLSFHGVLAVAAD